MLRRLAAAATLPMERKKLIQLVHVKAGELQMDEDTRRALQRQLTGKGSCAEMTEPELQTVYRRLRLLSEDAGLGKRKPRRFQRDERLPVEPPTPQSLRMIEHLWADLNVRTSAQMQALGLRIIKHPWAQTREEANKLIEGLKAMRARGWRATHGGKEEGVTG